LEELMAEKSWAPSRKWVASVVVAVGALATAWAQAGEWSSALTVMAIGVGVQAATAYLLPNAPDERSSWGSERGEAVPWLLAAVLWLVVGVVVFAAGESVLGLIGLACAVLCVAGMVVGEVRDHRRQMLAPREFVDRERIGW
jgi:hypothetical protein